MSEERFKGDYEQPGDEKRKTDSESSFDKLPKKNNKENNGIKPEAFVNDLNSEAKLRKDLVEDERKKLIERGFFKPAELLAVFGFLCFNCLVDY